MTAHTTKQQKTQRGLSTQIIPAYKLYANTAAWKTAFVLRGPSPQRYDGSITITVLFLSLGPSFHRETPVDIYDSF